jgi:hypothetical protein
MRIALCAHRRALKLRAVRSPHEALAHPPRTLARWAPTADGPVDHAEQTDADELRQETLVKENKRIEREQEEGGDRRDREV